MGIRSPRWSEQNTTLLVWAVCAETLFMSMRVGHSREKPEEAAISVSSAFGWRSGPPVGFKVHACPSRAHPRPHTALSSRRVRTLWWPRDVPFEMGWRVGPNPAKAIRGVHTSESALRRKERVEFHRPHVLVLKFSLAYEFIEDFFVFLKSKEA